MTTHDAKLFLPDWSNHRIRKADIASALVTTFTGSGTKSSVDGIGTAATHYGPIAICVDFDNVLMYTCDFSGHVVRITIISTASVSTLAGLAGSSGTTAAYFHIGMPRDSEKKIIRSSM